MDKTKVEKKADALSFKQLIDIINTEYKEEQDSSHSKDYFGGYTI